MNKTNLNFKNIFSLSAISVAALFATNTFAQNNQAPAVDIQYQAPSSNVNVVDGQDVTGFNPTNSVLNQQAVGQGIMTPTGQIIPATPNPPVTLPGGGSNYNQASTFSGQSMMPTDPQSARLIQLLNADPEHIRQILRDMAERDKASKDTGNSQAVQSSVNIHLTPGSDIPVIRTYANRPTALVITDQTGKPWPIENFSVGGSSNFVVRRFDNVNPYGSMLDITPKENFVDGNLVLKLVGLDYPVTMELISGQSKYDSPLTARVMAYGPNTSFTEVKSPAQNDPRIYSVLSGVVPDTMKPLKITDGLAQAWLTDNGKTMFVRTKLNLQVFNERVASADGTYAYKMTPMPTINYRYQDKFGYIPVSGF